MSIHAAAIKAIEWFSLDAEAMSAKSDETEDSSSETQRSDTPEAPKPSPAKTAPVSEKSAPNTPLKFRLEKLEIDHPYLIERGLSPETIKEFGIGYCAKGMMVGRIAIPIQNPEGHVVAYAGRWLGEPTGDVPKYKLPPGFRKSLELFNIDRAIKESGDGPLVIVEGFFGCMNIHQHGCRKVVALMGSSMSSEQEALIRKYTNQNTKVLLMLDEDEAGRAGRENIAFRLSKFVWVKVHAFEKENQQPENLTAEEVAALIA